MDPTLPITIAEKLFPSTLVDTCYQGLDEVAKIYYRENILLFSEQAKKLCNLTIEQNNCHWFSARKPRITASEAHRIYRARTPHTRLSYFTGNQSSLPLENFKYGHQMEPLGVKKYEEVAKYKVFKSGIVVKLDKCFIAASPDGLVLDENGDIIVLEVKCPISCKDSKIVVEYLEALNPGEPRLNYRLSKKHQYFCQVQLLMYCCGAKKCHFFVYSSVDHVLVNVDYDEKYV